MDITQLDDYDDVLASLLESLDPALRQSVLDKLPPEQRLAGLPPEQRLAGLPPEEALLALPDSVLRGFSVAYLDALPAHVRDAVRARIGH